MNRFRRNQIKEILVSKPYTSYKELFERFPNTSTMTIRRDIEFFEATGDVIRVRGGARAMRFINVTKETPYYKRASEGVKEKTEIAELAAKYIETGRSLYFDSGSTIMQLVGCIEGQKLTISTSDPEIAIALLNKEQVNINIVGGMLNRTNVSISGNPALDFVAKTNIDVAFISPSGYSVECGFSCGNYNENMLKKAVVDKARVVVALVTSNKFSKIMPYTFAETSAVNVVITEKMPDESVVRALKEAGVKLEVYESLE